jgi:polysaccharide biosynthesis transport protein
LSKTFELLQRLEKEQELAVVPPATKTPPVLPPAVVFSGIPEERLERMGTEEVVKMVQRVFRGQGEEATRVVTFSSVDRGNGCSWICVSAAFTLANQTQGTVCVVDGNLRYPSLQNYFHVENRFGLAEATAHPGPIRDFVQPTSSKNLWVLTAGGRAVQPPLSSDGLLSRITELRSEFDYVLIDTPPANLYADAISLARFTDGIVLVLQSNSTRREAALKVKEGFETAKVRMLGAVLNKRTFPIPQAVYERL